MLGKKQSMAAGAASVAPILLGVAPFGMIFGAVAASSGIPAYGAAAMSLAVFAGASQLAAVGLLAEHAPLSVVVFTGLVINVRMLMYSASLAPHFSGLSAMKKAPLAYILTDQAYAMSISRFTGRAEETRKPYYYAGAGLLLWIVWQMTTLLGAFAGAAIPPEWSLDFAIPLTFLALVVPAVRDRANAVAAVCAGVVALLAYGLPYNLGLVAAAVCGIVAGYAAEKRSGRYG